MRRVESVLDGTALLRIAGQFALGGPVDSATPCGSGLINDTFLVTAGGTRYVLQRINDRVFTAPERIMENLRLLTEHLARQPPSDIKIPAVVPAQNGGSFVRGADGGLWRTLTFVPDAVVLPRIDTAAQAREAGRALGRFHYLVRDLDAASLAVTLPGFHASPLYLERFTRALGGAKAVGWEPAVCRIATFVEARRDQVAVLEAALREGRIATRVVHGDPKLDNILFSGTSGRALSLVDLDTVQPGLIQHDIADCLRSCCNRRGEGASEKAEVRFDLDTCRGILESFARETPGLLGPGDVEVLFDAIRLLPFELGLRFATDHLEGDHYFRVSEPGQNLRKAEVQFALVEDIERKEREIREIVQTCFRPRSVCGSSSPKDGEWAPADTMRRENRETVALLAALGHLRALLTRIGHVRTAEVTRLISQGAAEPDSLCRALNDNSWWGGAGSLAADSMADNPGLSEASWRVEVREFRELLIEIGEVLMRHGDENPGVSSWVLAFRNWNASEV